MYIITSAFQSTAIVPADPQGPYVVPAGSPVTLTAKFTHPDATYAWVLGDGTTANTAVVTHTYRVQGTYIAKLTVVVNEPGGAESRSFACVRVLDVAATVDAGPDRTVNEGDVVDFTATFTDPELSLSHVAIWRWGDNQTPTAGGVVETHTPPLTRGTVTASHAWGDAGTYRVTLLVRDTLGATGIGTCNVKVLNVPPTVHAGAEMFAYRGSVITLEGRFTDPGWLDAHVGSWDFGDCTGAQPAIIRERNLPPIGRGVALASHVYASCGTYQATCTVVDDDGAAAQSRTIVRVVEIENAGFEGGFGVCAAGEVGNGWEPYAATIATFHTPSRPLLPRPGTYHGEALRVHRGRRAQRIVIVDASRAGVWQQIGSNPGWIYQISVFYAVLENSPGMVRLGVDPLGRMDANAPEVVWSVGRRRGCWVELAVRVNAKASRITIFLEAVGVYEPTEEEREEAEGDIEDTGTDVPPRAEPGRERGLGVDVFFDDVTLIPIQHHQACEKGCSDDRCTIEQRAGGDDE